MPEVKASFRGVTKVFGRGAASVQALEPVTLDIPSGAFVCLLGPSGCGKSTLLNILAGFEPVTEGEVLMDGAPVRGPSPQRGVVFQQGALFTWMTVLDNVAFGPVALGKGQKEAEAIARRFLDMVGLSAFSHRYPYELSGGMQQRVGIARALANDPEILLMDEPFAALDEITRFRLNDDLLALWRGLGKTVIFVTHSVFESVYLSQRVLVMTPRPGRIAREFRINGAARDADFRTSAGYAAACRDVSAALAAASDNGGGR